MSVVLLDSRSDSLTVSWPGNRLANSYILECRTSDSDWVVLSEVVRQTQVRKKNLDAEFEYFFRVAAVFDDGEGEWMTHEEGFYPLTKEEEEYAMPAPRVRKMAPETLAISWDAVEGAYGYELQMRENVGGADWFTVAEEIDVVDVYRRKLTSRYGYMFRVRPLNGEYEEAFSPPSKVLIPDLNPKKPSKAKGSTRSQPASQAPPEPEEEEVEEEEYSMAAPWVKNAGPQALLIRWVKFEGATGYELQMRENTTKGKWATIAEHLSGTEVIKKNLTSMSGYQFRVLPKGTEEDRYSAASYGAVASQAPKRQSRGR